MSRNSELSALKMCGVTGNDCSKKCCGQFSRLKKQVAKPDVCVYLTSPIKKSCCTFRRYNIVMAMMINVAEREVIRRFAVSQVQIGRILVE